MRAAPRILAALLLLATTLLLPAAGRAQLRYMATFDLREQFNSNVFAGVVDEYGYAVEPQRDLVTELEPALRLYLGLPRDLLSARYAFVFQIFASTQNEATGGNVMGYGNTLNLGYNHLFTERVELALANRFRQGTETVNVPGGISNGTTTFGSITAGSKYIADTLQAGLNFRVSERWNVAPTVVGEVYSGYDHTEDLRIIPPPLASSITISNQVQRAFTIGELALVTDYAFLTEYRDPAIVQFDGFPPWLSSMLGAATLRWRHQLTELWDYTLGGGFDVRVVEQYQQPSGGGPAQNVGYGPPSANPTGEASLRFRWQNSLSATLGYGHRTQSVLANQVSTLTNVDEVGLDFFMLQGDWRFELFGAYRFMGNTTRDLDQPDLANQDGTHQGRVNAAVIYVLRPGISLGLTYNLELVANQLAYTHVDPNNPSSPLQVSGADYARHLITVGVSLAWPPPPPQDVALNRRASEYEPLFTFTTRRGAADDERGPAGVDQEGRGSGDPRCDVPEQERDPVLCPPRESGAGGVEDERRP